MEIKAQLQALGIELRRISTTGKTVCPKCSHERKNKNDPCLSVNVQEGTYKCHNCDWKGRVFEKQFFEKKVYVRPVFNNRTDLSVKLVNWFAARCISQQTLIDFKLSESKEWMPGVNKEVNTVQFNYFIGDDLINIKYRDAAKNFKLYKEACLIMYNLNSIKDCTECVICEGEIDAMSWHQAGYKAVVSVPNGASKNQKLEYLDNCIEYFENKTKIFLSSDDDEPGRVLRDELARRLGLEVCFKVDLAGSKDANEYLVANGPESLLECLKTAQAFPITGVYSVADIMPDVMDFYYNGLPEGDRTGDVRLDEYLRFMPGELTMVTGIPSHGKTIFLEDISLKLAINSGWSWGVFSPESHPIALYISRLIKKVVGRKVSVKYITPQDMENVGSWLQDKYHIIFPESEDFLLDTILSKAAQLVKRKGINGLIIDPWNRIEGNMPNGYSESKYTAEQLIKIVKFNQRYGVHTFLVAHPTKMQKDTASGNENYTVPNLYSISGSAHFFNITQNGFTVFKNDKDKLTEIHIQKVKWEHIGKKGMLQYRYCSENSRLLEPFQTQTEIRNGYAANDCTPWIANIDLNAPSEQISSSVMHLNTPAEIEFKVPDEYGDDPF